MTPWHLCRHCGRPGQCRKRLCSPCYRNPAIAGLYPSGRVGHFRPAVPTSSRSPLPAEPTAAAPGSAPRIRVFEERAFRGESLFRPGDATLLEPAHAS